MIYVGVVGSRRRNEPADKAMVKKAIVSIHPPITLVSGGCRKGADRFAEELAVELSLPLIVFPPKVEGNDEYAYAKACYARNTLIAKKSDILIACVAPDRKGGTEDTVKKFLKMDKDRLILVHPTTLEEFCPPSPYCTENTLPVD